MTTPVVEGAVIPEGRLILLEISKIAIIGRKADALYCLMNAE